MASAYATLAASGVYHNCTSCRRSSTPKVTCSSAGQEDNSGEQRIDKDVADNVVAAMQPIAGYSGRALAGVCRQDRHQPGRPHRRQP